MRAERQQQQRHSSNDLNGTSARNFAPVSNLYSLSGRGCADHDLSSLILQNELIKKDRRLAYRQLDIDRCNALIFAYVKRGVAENSNYYLRRKLVETFGQTNRAVLINRLRLVAVLLGGEKGRGGMDPQFTPIREEAHRFSPYVVVMIDDYIKKLEEKMKRRDISSDVPGDFKEYVDSLGTAFDSERGIANTGARYRDDLAREVYAMKVLLRDLREYYGERVGAESGEASSFEVIFSDQGTFQSDTLNHLAHRHSSITSKELTDGFIQLGLELRAHLSELRDSRRPNSRVDDEEVNQLKKLNEIVATLTGLFAAERHHLEPLTQAETLVDILYLEGLYSKKNRKALRKELSALDPSALKNDQKIKALYTFLNFMSGLAYSRMDEALGEAARAYSVITREAENYLEIQARKSSLQGLGQLQIELHDAHRSLLAGKKDIHLSGTARGLVKVFQSQSDITSYLRGDPRNGEDTIWILKSGLTMPNEASFAAIILEDPIMKASHYDGYARSKQPPIPLLQVPGATDAYAHLNGKHAKLEAIRSPHENVTLTVTDSSSSHSVITAAPRIHLATSAGSAQLFEIDSTRSNDEIRALQMAAGSKAANYALLRSVLPRDPATNEEHIYPGFAIPFHFYQQHIAKCRANRDIARLGDSYKSHEIRDALQSIQAQILDATLDSNLFDLMQAQLERRMQAHRSNRDGSVKLRFRSSSNAEDNKDFSGAGLYESHFAYYTYASGRSSNGRSYEENEQHIAAAVKSVWASLWKPEAYFARERAGIVQETVAMGILVHPSYRKEESTGVVFHYSPDDIEIVINDGNENVQNPNIAGLTPELHRIHNGTHHVDFSSRFILSEKRILSNKDHAQLMGLLETALPKFKELYPDQEIPGIDVEFKILELPVNPDAPDDGKKDVVMLKQIRPLAKRQ